ncbi:Cell wall surface anchor family protein [Rhodotorula toruloides]|nr:Cell wall surface anchor family protein [Rhodotorula toruloides]
MSAHAQQVSASTANSAQVPRGVAASQDGLNLPSTDEDKTAENSLARRKLELLDLPDDILLGIIRNLHALFFDSLGWDDPAGEQVEGSRFIPPLKYITLSRRIYNLARPIWLSRLSTWRLSAPNGSLNMRHNERIWSRVDEFADQVRSLYSVVQLETSIEELSLVLRFDRITHLKLELHIGRFIPAFARYLRYFRQLVSLELVYWADDRRVTDEALFEIDTQLPTLRSLSLSGEQLTNLFLTMPCTGLQVLTFDIDITALPLQIPWSSLKKLTLTGMADPSSGAAFRQTLEDIAASPPTKLAWPLTHLGLIDRNRPDYYRSIDANPALIETYRVVLSLFGSKSAFSTLTMDETWLGMVKSGPTASLPHVTSLRLRCTIRGGYVLSLCPQAVVLELNGLYFTIIGDIGSIFPTKQPKRRGRFDQYFFETPAFLVKLASTKILRFTLEAEDWGRLPFEKLRHDWWRASEEDKFVCEA